MKALFFFGGDEVVLFRVSLSFFLFVVCGLLFVVRCGW